MKTEKVGNERVGTARSIALLRAEVAQLSSTIRELVETKAVGKKGRRGRPTIDGLTISLVESAGDAGITFDDVYREVCAVYPEKDRGALLRTTVRRLTSKHLLETAGFAIISKDGRFYPKPVEKTEEKPVEKTE